MRRQQKHDKSKRLVTLIIGKFVLVITVMLHVRVQISIFSRSLFTSISCYNILRIFFLVEKQMFLLVLVPTWRWRFPSISNLSKYNHHSLRKRLSIPIMRLRLNKKVPEKNFYIFFIYNSCFHESSSLFQRELHVVGLKYFCSGLDDFLKGSQPYLKKHVKRSPVNKTAEQ